MKKQNPENCPSRLWKTYIQHVGFINSLPLKFSHRKFKNILYSAYIKFIAL